jgi:hypothetical protein
VPALYYAGRMESGAFGDRTWTAIAAAWAAHRAAHGLAEPLLGPA